MYLVWWFMLFIREEWLRLLTLLKAGLLRQISSAKLLQISKNTFQHRDFGGETGKDLEEFQYSYLMNILV